MRLGPRRESPGTGMGITKVGGYASLNKCVFSWLLKRSIVCSDLTVFGSFFHSAGAATAKPRLPMCFLGRVEETDSLLPRERLLDLIKDERYGGCDRLIALNTRRLYLKRIRC